jgi:hypothetical protein
MYFELIQHIRVGLLACLVGLFSILEEVLVFLTA